MRGGSGNTASSSTPNSNRGWRGGGGGWRGGARGNGSGWRGRSGGWRARGGGGSGRGNWNRSRGSNWTRRAGNSSVDDSIDDSNIPTQGLLSGNSRMTDYFELTDCPYLGWAHYLPKLPFNPSAAVITKIETSIEYLKEVVHVDKEILMEQLFFEVDMNAMLVDRKVLKAWPRIKEDLEENAELVSGILGLAKHHIEIQDLRRREGKENVNFPTIRARIIYKQEVTPLRILKSSFYNRLITIRGTVIRISNIRPLNLWLTFQCDICTREFAIFQADGKYSQPLRCPEQLCKNRKSFTPLRGNKNTKTVDMQQIRLQEVSDEEGGRVPRNIEVELTEDTCDSCIPGDVISVTGVVKVVAEESSHQGKSSGNSVYLLYLSALSVQNVRSAGSRNNKIGGMDLTNLDMEAVNEIQNYGPRIFKLLVNSLCPSIFGMNVVKAAFLLGLFGGTKIGTSEDQVATRSDPHILVVGDPGMGKSQILGSVAAVAPRGVFVTGNTSTTSGLTVSLAKDQGGETSIEAGALVLADQGCCCIDEFDKMSTQHQALLEAMEQQCISVAKAGIVCSLPARTAIMAAANPVGGHYNRAKTVSENVKLNPALLSRFDLVFILLDKPDTVIDTLLSDHVMHMHSKKGKDKKNSTENLFRRSREELVNNDGNGADLPLEARLTARPGDGIAEDPVPPAILRKYLAYARKTCFPKLNKEARDVIKEFYLDLRRNHQSHDGTPITTRQLESMKRLTEARAKLELRDEATEQDARDVVEMMKLSLVDTMTDEFGNFDLNRSHMGSGMSQRNAGKRLISALQREGHRMSKNTFHLDEIKNIARMAQIPLEKLVDLISSLNNQGFLIKKSSKVYQMLSLEG